MRIDFKEELAVKTKYIEKALQGYITVNNNYQQEIYEAMRYSLLAGGKRIRPVLALAAADIVGVDHDEILPFVCALEMIHTYSLIHDDLPAMDNDDLRRGRPTCHKQFSEAIAILAGDALLNKAFELMSSGALGMEKPLKGLKIIKKVAALSGEEGMIGGQVVDLRFEGKKIDTEILEYMYSLKTGALLKAPIYIAILAAEDEIRRKYECALLRYAEIIGVAFQIKDDILDVEGDSATLGKAVGRDEKENKSTFVAIYGIDYCKQKLKALTDEAVSIAAGLNEKGAFLKELAIYLLERNY